MEDFSYQFNIWKLINNHSSNLMLIDPQNPFHEHNNIMESNNSLPANS